MDSSLPVPDPVTPKWLTTVMRQAGVLPTGMVEAVEQEHSGSINSATYRLLVWYSPDAIPGSPDHLVLKCNNPTEWGVEAGADEVRFYTLLATLPAHPHITVPCYAATYDQDTGESFLLLRDLSATHQPPVTRDQQVGIVDAVPSAEAITRVVDTLAELHAYWWEHSCLDTEQFPVGYWSGTADRFARYLKKRAASWSRLMAAESPGSLSN